MDVNFCSIATDVVVTGIRDVRTASRKLSIRPTTVLESMEAEIEVDANGGRMRIADAGGDHRMSGEQRTLVTCGKSGKAYRRVDSLSAHGDNCRGDPPNRQGLKRAAHMAMDMVEKTRLVSTRLRQYIRR